MTSLNQQQSIHEWGRSTPAEPGASVWEQRWRGAPAAAWKICHCPIMGGVDKTDALVNYRVSRNGTVRAYFIYDEKLERHMHSTFDADAPTADAPTADAVQVGGTHYKDMPIQPWAVMETLLTREEFIGFLKGNYLKYAMRAGRKGDATEDANKAVHYKQKLDEVTR